MGLQVRKLLGDSHRTRRISSNRGCCFDLSQVTALFHYPSQQQDLDVVQVMDTVQWTWSVGNLLSGDPV